MSVLRRSGASHHGGMKMMRAVLVSTAALLDFMTGWGIE